MPVRSGLYVLVHARIGYARVRSAQHRREALEEFLAQAFFLCEDLNVCVRVCRARVACVHAVRACGAFVRCVRVT